MDKWPGILIHHGNSAYDPKMFKPVSNGMNWHKPRGGGLWTSPINSKWGWRDWCKAEDIWINSSLNHFLINLNENANIYIIDNLYDLKKMPFHNDLESAYIAAPDFELLSKSYDAIWLTMKGEQETRFSHKPYSLYGWDCETVLILTPNCFSVISQSDKIAT